MRPALFARAGTLAAALALLAACDGGGGTGDDRLTAADVAGVYNLCALRFAPANSALPVANLLQTVVDTTPPAGRPEATVSLATNGAYDLVYTRQGDAFLQQLRGSLSFGRSAVNLSLPEGNAIAAELLLPRPLSLNFQDGPTRRLSTQTAYTYPVSRESYAKAAGISGTDLQPTVTGALTIELTTGACG